MNQKQNRLKAKGSSQKVFRLLSAIVLSLVPLFGAGLFSLLGYVYLPLLWRIVLAVILFGFAFWMAFLIAKLVYKQGLIRFITNVSATPELDGIQEDEKKIGR